MENPFIKEVLRTVVCQICQTIGWHAIQGNPLELMMEFMHRFLLDVSRTTHRYCEQFGQTMPNLDHLGLAFQDMSINLQDLEDYVRNVEPVPSAVDVPKFPVERETHLNFLKPGSNEVVHRPVHVHEHLPPMHPDLEDSDKKPPLIPEVPTTSADGSMPSTGVFKRPGDPLESPALKRTRLLLEEEGRPLREISSVIMTTSGFLSPAREGKLPDARPPVIPCDIERESPPPPPSSTSYPAAPPEAKSEKKVKKSLSKKSPMGSKKLDKESGKKKDKSSTKTDKPKVKKLASMKEVCKLKALKSKAKQLPTIASEGNPKDFANFIQNLFQSSQSKNKPDDSPWLAPGPSKEPNPTERVNEPVLLEGKLSTEPDKQKLNIFKKIPKVKEEKMDKVDREETTREIRESNLDVVIDEVIERPWTNAASTSAVASVTHSSDIEEVYISDTLSPPGTPSTPKTPEFPSKLDKTGSKKRKKDKSKSKSKSKVPSKKVKIETIDLETSDRPKTPEVPPVNLFSFPPQFPPVPGLIPPQIIHPLFPNLPFLKQNFPLPGGLSHPAMPNLPIPPPSFMQAPILPHREEPVVPPETTITVVEKPVEKVEKEKKPKEAKKEDKKPKKKKLKKEKIKSKEKGEKKKEKEEKKVKDKEKSKEKKEKKKEREREERTEPPAVPKITLKLGLDTSRPATPEQSRKIVIKPVVKKDEVPPVVEAKRAASPELARISALITRQPKKSKTPETPETPETKAEKVKDATKKASHAAPPTKETVAFYHHARASGPATAAGSSSSKPPHRGAGGGARGTGDDSGNKVWICPACKGPDDGSPMIGCDDCDAWYHWVCVGIQVPPDAEENWYCRECIQRKQGSLVDKKKKLKKKNKVQ